MIYLDYSATTPVNKEVLDTFYKINLDFIGNANSLHELGIKCNNLVESASRQIKEILNLNNKEIIYTSGASEANNLAIIGLALKYQNRGKHIVTSHFEHSSVYGPLKYLENLGFEISYVKSNENGIIDLDNLKELIRDDTILVTINAINSELGIKQPFLEIGNILKKYSKCFYHVDLTQAIGKIQVNLENVDLASFSAHKFYGLKGIGCLIKNTNILLEPLIHGGKSTSIYRSGTPSHPLIASLAKALRLASINLDEKYSKVQEMNNYLKQELIKYHDVYVNSNKFSIPHILNVSVVGIKPESFMHALSKYGIYISTKSACSDANSISESVFYLTKDKKRATSSLRISLSYLTTIYELEEFLIIFDKVYQELKSLK